MMVDNRLVRWLVLAMMLSALLTGCSTAPVQKGDQLEPPLFPPERVLTEDVDKLSETISDPFEGFNRTMYRFNYGFDRYLLLPVVNTYQALMPDFAEAGVSNFFSNIREVPTFINCVLQFKAKKTVQTTGRFVVNSTIGLLGLFDVASAMGIPKHQEDFGQTLGYWGVGNGPYLVLPIFGPSNLRDGVGLGADTYVRNHLREQALDPNKEIETAWDVLNSIDTRANIAFRYYETGSPFEYELVRLLYTTKRKIEIED